MSLPGAMLTYDQALELAGGLFVAGVVVGRTRLANMRAIGWAVPVALEAALVSLLFAIWQLAHSIAVTHVAGGTAHGKDIWNLERTLHLPSERSLQLLFLPHHTLVKFGNLYYAGVHFPATIAMLAWLFIRHRDRYKPVRTTLALATAMSLLIELIPTAPPRLIPVFGMQDTALAYGQSVYGAGGFGIADQLGAMPSVHVLWAVLVGATVIRVSSSRWRWLVLLHTVWTILVVVFTANHYWMDGIVAVGLIGLAVAMQTLARRLWRGRTPVLDAAPQDRAAVLVRA